MEKGQSNATSDYASSQATKLKIHVKTHSGEKSKKFKRKINFDKIKQTCKVCAVSFSCKSNLNKHTKKMHIDIDMELQGISDLVELDEDAMQSINTNEMENTLSKFAADTDYENRIKMHFFHDE